MWFETLSHKGLRLLMPLLHAAILVANVGLMSMEAYRLFLAGQVAFYAAAASALFVGQRRTTLLMRVPYTMCLLVWATVVGFVYFVTRQQHVTWERVVTTQGSGVRA